MQGGSSIYRVVASDISTGHDGAIAMFVCPDNGNDDYDGLSRNAPKKTIAGAIASSYTWANIFIDAGTYEETVTIDNSHTKIFGESRSGTTAVVICPTTGKGIVINGDACVIEGVSVRTTGANAIDINGADTEINRVHVSTMGEAIGINFAAERSRVSDALIDGNDSENAMGVYFGDAANDCQILESTITSCGSGLDDSESYDGAGVAIADTARDCLVKENAITDCRYGIYLYQAEAPSVYKGHAIYHNHFSSNGLQDIYDANGKFYGVDIAENFYQYSGFTDDEDGDGYADRSVTCGKSYDRKPLASKRAWMTNVKSRRVA